MATMVTINCKNCGKPKQVREADRKRGWGLFCDKRCKSIHQTRTTGRGAPRAYHDDRYDDDDYWDDDYWDDDDSTYWNGKEY